METSSDHTQLSWQTHEYETKNRHRDWNWYAGLIALIAAVISFFYGNIFFGIFAILAGALVIYFAHKQPEYLTITLTESEILINEQSIPYSSIQKFWLDETKKPDKLVMLVKGSFVPVVTIPLENVTAEQVRTVLKSYIPEEFIRPSTSSALFDRLGF